MAHFSYVAIHADGRRVKQTVVANSKIDVANILKHNNLFIVEISEVSERNTKLPKELKLSDKIFFTQNIATLLASGMSLGASISAIAEDTQNKETVSLYNAIRHDLEQGFSFAKALSRHPTIFDTIYISLVEAGESSGKLVEVMASLTKGLEKDGRTVNQVRSALLYPSFILLSLVLLGGLIMAFVMPKLIPIFAELKVKLPITTQLLVWVSKGFIAYPAVVLFVLALLVALVVFGFRSPRGKMKLNMMANRLPLINKIIGYLDLSRFSSAMALLLSAGVPIQKAIKISAHTVQNPKLRQEFLVSAEQISGGTSLSRTLANGSLPKTFIALVAVGERSGNIDAIFKTLAQHYEDLLDTSLKNFTGMIEPILTLVVGLIVGGTVLSVMVPIYQVVGTLGGGR